MADVIRRNHLSGEDRYHAEDRHRADEIHVHHRPQKRSWWPFALLGLLAVGLLAIWSYARSHRRMEARAPIEKIEKISPALPAPPPIERPRTPQAPILAPPAVEPEATEPDSGATAEPETEPGTETGMAAAGAGACSVEFQFAPNETAVAAKDEPKAKVLADCLKANPSETAIILEGRADPRGSADYNEGLAKGRAQSVADALIAAGVPAEQLTTSIGDQLCSEATQTCWQKNRSVTANSKH